MKVNLNTVITNLAGAAYQTDNGKEATLKYFLTKAFDSITESDSQTTLKQKLELYALIKRIMAAKSTIELSKTDIEKIMERVNMFSIPVIGTISDLLTSK